MIVKKGQRRFTGFDDKILSMYARGMTTRDIQGHLLDIYKIEVSPEFISAVTNRSPGGGKNLAESAVRRSLPCGVF